MSESVGSTQLFLTFAELELLLQTSARWPQIRAAFDLPSPVSSDETAAAGLASLAARGLVRSKDDELVLADAVAGAIGLVESATTWIRIAHAVAEEFKFGGSVGVGEPAIGHVVVTPVGFGCFELVGVEPSGSAVAAVASLAFAALTRSGNGVVAFGAGDVTETPQLSVSLDGDAWRVVTHTGARDGLDRDTARAAAEYELTALLAIGSVR